MVSICGVMMTEKTEVGVMTKMPMARIKRAGGIRINVSEDIEMRLQKISQTLGVPPSTLAAVAVGIWVSQQERSLTVFEAVASTFGAQIGESVSNEMREALRGLAGES